MAGEVALSLQPWDQCDLWVLGYHILNAVAQESAQNPQEHGHCLDLSAMACFTGSYGSPSLSPTHSTLHQTGLFCSSGAGTPPPEGHRQSLHLTDCTWHPTVFPGWISKLSGTTLSGHPAPSSLHTGGHHPSHRITLGVFTLLRSRLGEEEPRAH